MSAQPLHLQLWHGDVRVAEVENAFPHQGAWFGIYHEAVTPEQGPLPARLLQFILFCEDWHGRMARNEPHEPEEFDAYADLMRSGVWSATAPDGTRLEVDGAPVFVEGEVSWNHPGPEPSREADAHALWLRLIGA